MKPQAYNYWQGNEFRIPGLPVRPTYAPALAPQTSAAASSGAADTLAQLGFRTEGPGGIGEGMGRNESTLGTSGAPGSANAGMGPGAQVTSLSDMVGRVGTGIGMVTSPMGFAMGMGPLAGPTPKTSYSLRDLMPGAGLFDMVNGGGGNERAGDFEGPGGRATDAPETFGGLSELDMSLADAGFAGPSPGPGAPSTQGDPTQGEGPANLARGGKVKPQHLAGPNPPGPDDGLAYLDVGERVIPKRAVQKLEAAHGSGLFDLALNKGKLPAAPARKKKAPR